MTWKKEMALLQEQDTNLMQQLCIYAANVSIPKNIYVCTFLRTCITPAMPILYPSHVTVCTFLHA